MEFEEDPLAVAFRCVGEMQSWRQGVQGGGVSKEILSCKDQKSNSSALW